jgi:hypothetical protein
LLYNLLITSSPIIPYKQETMAKEGDNWKDTLPPEVDTHVDVLDKNWKSFRLNTVNTTPE